MLDWRQRFVLIFSLLLLPLVASRVAWTGLDAEASAGGVLVAPSNVDSQNGSIRFHQADSASALATVLSEGGKGQIQGLTLGPDGVLYGSFFDSLTNTNGQVLRIGPPGNKAEVFVAPGSGGLFSPSGLTFGPDSNLYVVNNRGFAPHNVLRFDGKTGAFIDVFATGLSIPQDVVFGPDGDWYVSNGSGNSVSRFNGATGASLGTFVSTGSGGLSGPIGMAFGPNGDLFVTSAFTSKVLRFSGTTGAFISEFASLVGVADTPTDLAFGPDGNLYVTGRTTTTNIYRFDRLSGLLTDQFVGGLQGLNTGIFFVDSACSSWSHPGALSGCFASNLPPAWWRSR